MTVLLFPEALNQGRAATLSDVLHYVAIVGGGCLFLGMLGYTLTLIALGFRTVFAKTLPFQVMHKASMTVGLAFTALIPLYVIPIFLYGPSDLAAIVGIALGLLALVFALGIAFRIVRRSAPSADAH